MNSEFLGDILECSVCLKPLDEQNKVLPCQHTFCKSCLHAIVRSQKELRCPECRVIVRQKVDDLPSNILLIRLLDGIKSQENQMKSFDKKPDTRRHSVEGILSEAVPATGGAKDGGKAGFPRNSRNFVHERTNSEPVVHTTGKPRAKAIFDYNSTLPSDLSFSKGDIIFLLKKIDDNWMSGECCSHIGVFPSNFVKVIQALPEERPICVALYDFAPSADDRDRDCLNFQKSEVILLIRRVDENWAEGMLRDSIGIFPLSFVQLNDKAKLMLDEMTSADTKGQHRGAAERRIDNKRAGKNTKKRHSFPTFYTTKPKEDSSHRHSMELVASSSSQHQPLDGSKQQPLDGSNRIPVPKLLRKKPNVSTTTTTSGARAPPIVTTSGAAASLTTSGARVATGGAKVPPNKILANVICPPTSNPIPQKNSATSSVSKLLPNKIVTATYSYQAQKADELSLVKGESYRILEVCNDGWCRGLNLRSRKVGAIPGNYIAAPTSSTVATKPSNSVTPRPLISSSVTPRPLTSGSVTPRPLTSSSVTPRPLTSGSVTPRPLTSGSVTPRPLTSSSVTPRPLTSSSVTPRPLTSSSVTPRPLTSSSVTPRPITSSSVTPRPLTSSSATPRPLTSSSATPRPLTSSSVTPRPITSSSVTPRPLTSSSATPRPLTSSSVTPRPITSSSVTPRPLTSSSVTPRPLTSSSVTPRPLPHKDMSSKERTYQQYQDQQKEQQKGKTPPMIPPPRPVAPQNQQNVATKSTNQQNSATKSTNQQNVATKSTNQQNVATRNNNNSSSASNNGGSSKSNQNVQLRKTSKNERGNVFMKMLSGSGKKSARSPPTRSKSSSDANKPTFKPLPRDKYLAALDYPASGPGEISLKKGDVVMVHRRDPDGWFEGTLQRTGKVGIFPATFLERVNE